MVNIAYDEIVDLIALELKDSQHLMFPEQALREFAERAHRTLLNSQARFVLMADEVLFADKIISLATYYGNRSIGRIDMGNRYMKDLCAELRILKQQREG